MEDFKRVYGLLWLRITRLWASLPVLFLAFLLYGIVTNLLTSLTTQLRGGMAIGFLRWALELAILTHLAGLMNQILRKERLSMEDLIRFDGVYFAPLSQVYFVIFLVEWVYGLFLQRLMPASLHICLLMAWSLVCAPVFELVYQGQVRMDQFFDRFLQFWKENGIVLLPYSLLCLLIYYWIGRSSALLALILPGPAAWSYLLLTAFLSTLYYFTKGLLFNLLWTSSKRSRAYREKSEPWR